MSFIRSITAYSNSRFGRGYGPILLDELRCHGYENDVSECQSNAWYSNDCDHSEDAAVSCSKACSVILCLVS